MLTTTTRLLLLAASAVVSAVGQPQSHDASIPLERGMARVVLEVGQVSVIRGTAQALFEGNIVRRQEMIVTGHESYAKFALADGSTFEVFPDSKVIFHDNPVKTYKDMLNVILGKVRVFIEHLNGPNYNSVTTPTAVISVRGTVFDVDVQDDDGTTEVGVEEGAVEVQNSTAPALRAPPILHKDESIKVYRGQPLLGKLIDHSGQWKLAMDRLIDMVRVAVAHGGTGGGIGGVGGTGTGGTVGQGDKGKNTGGSGTGSSTGGAAPPAGPTGNKSGGGG